MIAERSQVVCRQVGNRSAISQRLKTVPGLSVTTATCRTKHQPVLDLLATAKNSSTIELVAETFHLQQAKPPCGQIVLATYLRYLQRLANQSVTAL